MRPAGGPTISTCPTAHSSPQTEQLRLGAFPKKGSNAACIADLADNTIINFDVGGFKCWTTAGTLKSPNVRAGDAGNFFSKLVKASWHQSLKVLPDGEILVRIDRHGYAFGWVIDYLRCGGLPPLNDIGLLEAIRVEADFYGLFSLRDLAQQTAKNIAKQVQLVSIQQSHHLEYLCKAKTIESGVVKPDPATPGSPRSPNPQGLNPCGLSPSARVATPSTLPRGLARRFQAYRNSPVQIEEEKLSARLSTAGENSHRSGIALIEDEELSRSMLVNDVPLEPYDPCEVAVALAELHGRTFSVDEDF